MDYHLPGEIREKAVLDMVEDIGDLTLQEMEVMHITETLRRHGGNRDAAAKALGIHRATLFRKIKSLGISELDEPE